MDHTSVFHECKKRNEQKIVNLKSLESEIAHTRAQIEVKKNSTDALRRKQTQYRSIQPIQPQKQPLSRKSDVSSPSILLRRRRDLTQLLPTTPDMVCKKLEFYIKRQFELQKFISETEIDQIKHLIDRLPEKHDKQQTYQMVNALLQQVKQMREPMRRDFQVLETKEYKDIESFASKQKEKIEHLIKRRDELESKIKESETSLIQRVRELYTDPVVQSAVVKNIRIKAAAQQVDVELQSLMNQADSLVKNITSSKEFEAPVNKELIMKDVEAKIAKTAGIVNGLIQANETGNAAIRDNRVQMKDENRETIEQLLDDIKKEKVRLQLERLQTHKPSKSTTTPSDDRASHDAAIIKNTLSPYTSISLGEALCQIVNILESVDYLSKKSVEKVCADIRETLDKLVKKWESSLDKQHIPIQQDIPKVHDGIDNVIQSVDALRDHLEHTEMQYIEEQKEKLKEKMDMADQVEREMKTAQAYLNERSMLNQVGKEYEIDSKNFKEWLEQLEVNPDENEHV